MKLVQKVKENKTLSTTIILFLLLLISIAFWQIYQVKRVSQDISDLVEYKFDSDYLPSIDIGHYALWGVDKDNEKILLKRFNFQNAALVNQDGTNLTSIKIDPTYIYDEYEISIEEIGDWDEKQTNCIIMKGSNDNNQISFTTNVPGLDSTMGKFILATPTDQTSETNELSGIWFTNDLESENIKPSLDIPQLEGCWKWAAYVEHRGKFFQIGEFDRANQADDFKDYSFAQIGDPIPVPGEDYLRNIPYAPFKLNNLSNRVVVSIEPRETQLRLKTEHEPFWPILEYIFNGEEAARIPLEMDLAPQGELGIEINTPNN